MKFFYLKRRFWVTVFAGLLVLGWVVKKAHVGEVVGYLKEADPLWFSGAFACSVGSYICIGEIMKTLIKATRRNLTRASAYLIAFVSTVVNYVMSVGGISGLTVKVYLLSKKKIPAGETLSISVIHGFFTNTIAVFIVVAGCFFTVRLKIFTGGIAIPVFFIVCCALFFGFLCTAVVVSNRVRELCWLLLKKIAEVVPGPGRIKGFFSRLDGAFRCFHESMLFLTKSTGGLARTAAYALADWVLMFGCLYLSFLAVHYNVSPELLIVGFCTGLLVSLISLIPGGLGIYEGSMVGVFYLMGLDYEKSLAAVMIYRLLYFFIPAVVGLVLLGRELVVD
ncbi:lysylphosphatidylglycerol synthase transmembrane domain-containing protein [Thermodesulforhabdus norvegica]|uniref:Uncharacterized protein n=1 Tax=Thermodesulforhabdus norvegica TaxID=39841 RepID=A0A1I4QKS9_9BACT|nr:lysylphosphatidylglycerol synthase transmembrane domain-containing protein [Thermodesulforhabdus norvegica]SFM40661.1 conserved hypothetical protein [Thermodesulforhabdus norvegica]